MTGRGVDPSSMAAAVTIGGAERYRLWIGRSGRRHVFTRIEDGRDAADLEGAVVMIAAPGPGGVDRPLWIGEAGRAPLDGLHRTRRVFAHWLAETATARAAVIADLGGETRRTAGVDAVLDTEFRRAA